MDKQYKIIFVCEWNTCRSAMAKYIFKYLVKKYELADKIFVDSAGCRVRFSEPIGKRTKQTLQQQNIPLDDEHISKPFTIQQYEKFDCIIALDNRTLQITKKFHKTTPKIKFAFSRIVTEKISALPIRDRPANILKLLWKFL